MNPVFDLIRIGLLAAIAVLLLVLNIQFKNLPRELSPAPYYNTEATAGLDQAAIKKILEGCTLNTYDLQFGTINMPDGPQVTTSYLLSRQSIAESNGLKVFCRD